MNFSGVEQGFCVMMLSDCVMNISNLNCAGKSWYTGRVIQLEILEVPCGSSRS